MAGIRDKIVGMCRSEEVAHLARWASSPDAKPIRQMALFAMLLWTIDMMAVGPGSNLETAVLALWQQRWIKAFALVSSTCAWLAGAWAAVLVIETFVADASRQEQQAVAGVRRRTRRNRRGQTRWSHRKPTPAASPRQHQIVIDRGTDSVKKSSSVLRAELLADALPLKRQAGTAVDRCHSATIAEPLEASLDALLWRYGPSPPALLSALTEHVQTSSITARDSEDVPYVVMRRVIRITWTDVPMMLQPMIGDETFLELHEDVVVCSKLGVSPCGQTIWKHMRRFLNPITH